MKALKWILIVVVLLIVLFVAVGYMLPREVVVTTSEKVNLPPQKVFHFIAGFVDRTAWDPWIKNDTAAETIFEIQDGYIGSKYKWDGPKVGRGTEEVDSVVIGSYILNKVSLMPESSIPEEWTFTPDGNGTDLTWTIRMTADNPMGRIANSIFRKMVQKTMDSGKIDLKNYLETHGVKMSSTTELGTDDFAVFEALVCSGSGTTDQSAAMLGEYFARVRAVVEAQKLQTMGMPFAVYTNFDPATGRCDVTAGFPVSAGGKTAGEVKAVKFPAFKAVKAIHTGPYDELTQTYDAIKSFAATNNLNLTGDTWEYYFNSPADVKDPLKLQTLVVMPLKK
jgi:effector-binding domain-containing protein